MRVEAAGSVRWFSWRRTQRHRPGLQYLVSTGRQHGFESLEEAKVLLALDFAGDLIEVISQPLRLRFTTVSGWANHIPDFLAISRRGVWLIDVRPHDRIANEDWWGFAAAAEAALAGGWHYVVVSRWRANVATTLGTLASRRLLETDPLNLEPTLLDAATGGATFGELAANTEAPAVSRAQLLRLLWRRQLGIDLSEPLTDDSWVLRRETP
ncbi:TnsA-like heteromeric transposase endonuclease subunit [Spirillospora sp. NPDC048911]|uniref:TnsA-like heteromeric transposase endonuclease subunit n=1 Tax=Spirillospora sp. NPDC048911 TaxID=3364527 RepID=UPI003721EFB5